MTLPDRNELARLATALGGLPVLGCHPGSPAERAGICYGDIVLSVNGVATPDWASFISARGKSNVTMSIDLFRNGRYLTLEIALAASPIDPPSLLAELVAQHIVPLAPGALDRRAEAKKPN